MPINYDNITHVKDTVYVVQPVFKHINILANINHLLTFMCYSAIKEQEKDAIHTQKEYIFKLIKALTHGNLAAFIMNRGQ